MDVHVAHCCVRHGCKYKEWCPVVSGDVAQKYACEQCSYEDDDPMSFKPIKRRYALKTGQLYLTFSGHWTKKEYIGDDTWIFPSYGDARSLRDDHYPGAKIVRLLSVQESKDRTTAAAYREIASLLEKDLNKYTCPRSGCWLDKDVEKLLVERARLFRHLADALWPLRKGKS